MTDNSTATTTIDLSGTTFLETTILDMAIPGTEDDSEPKLTGWKLVLAGPAHPATVAMFKRQANEATKLAAEKEQARVNGKKWKAPEADADESRKDTVRDLCARILGWEGAPDFGDGKGPRVYSPETAIDIFMDRSKGPYFAQLVKKLLDDRNFLKASANG